MGGTAEVAGVWAESERPDITLACGDCRGKLLGPIGLADVKTIPFGSLCKLHQYFFPHVTPMLATNALALAWSDVPAVVMGVQGRGHAERARVRNAPTAGPSSIPDEVASLYTPPSPWGPLYAPQPSSLSKANDDMAAALALEASRRRAAGAVGPVTSIAARLLCSWSYGKPETLNPPEQSVAAAVDYARRLVAMTGGE